MVSAAPRLPIHSPNSPDHATTISTSKEANYKFVTSYISALNRPQPIGCSKNWRPLAGSTVTLALRNEQGQSRYNSLNQR